MTINLRVSWSYQGERKSEKLGGLADSTNLDELKGSIEKMSGISKSRQSILTGFPPKPIPDGSMHELIALLGIVNGSAISVLEGPEIANEVTIQNANSVSTDMQSDNRESMKSLLDFGFSSDMASKALMLSGGILNDAIELCLSGGLDDQMIDSSVNTNYAPTMIRRVINADNSCLFNSISYCLHKQKTGGAAMRRVITQVVSRDPEIFTEAILGKAPSEYCAWIENPDKWGGEIELFILSNHFGVEICVVDILTGNLYKYGAEKNFPLRIFLLYDGVHYDVISEAHNPTAPESMDTTQFLVQDEIKAEDAKAIAADLRSRKQYVNLGGCDLKCLVCEKGLRGEKEAREHAVVTKHQNFSQI